jgi:hypothetical protein
VFARKGTDKDERAQSIEDAEKDNSASHSVTARASSAGLSPAKKRASVSQSGEASRGVVGSVMAGSIHGVGAGC